ncbi:YbaN family protein [Pseudomonas sp. LRF_L74]|uniref:YbaN family protein n=1 Tax=Pseudomonas sp. LRF_L74 TaxID=3369422 RepID=UPI003F6425CC
MAVARQERPLIVNSDRPQLTPPTRGFKRLAYLALAYASLGCAILGIILPGLPATEFILLSAWAATKSSPRLSHWLHNHKLFGPPLRNWRDGRLISRKSKLLASMSMSLCLAILIWHQPPLWVLLCAAGGMGCGALWIWSRPEARPPRA